MQLYLTEAQYEYLRAREFAERTTISAVVRALLRTSRALPEHERTEAARQ
jgi:hypothetical protein